MRFAVRPPNEFFKREMIGAISAATFCHFIAISFAFITCLLVMFRILCTVGW
jgi:hypothetical protein